MNQKQVDFEQFRVKETEEIEFLKNAIKEQNLKIEISNSSYEGNRRYTMYIKRWIEITKEIQKKFKVIEVGALDHEVWIRIEAMN